MQENKPICILFAGMVGTSKTPIATYISWKCGLPIFNNDAIRSEVHEDTLSQDFDEKLYLNRRDERLKELLSSKKNFVLDASIDRSWKKLKEMLVESDYHWLIISLDLSHDFVLKLYESKSYDETAKNVDQLYAEHQGFIDEFSKDIFLRINDNNFSQRLDICFKAVSAAL
jgi:hypothetical protein